MKKYALYFMFAMLLCSTVFAAGSVANDTKETKVIMDFFYGDGCPHCAALEPVLKQLEEKYPQLEINYYETWHNKKNAELFVNLSKACGTNVQGVPTVFIGEDVIVGFNEKKTPKQLEQKITDCLLNGCIDPIHKLSCEHPTETHSRLTNTTVDLPFIGEVDTKTLSLPIFTFLIALLDGFNPCAMWVLTFLLTLIIYAKSRKKIILIGGIFVITSGLIYFLFMTAWLNLFLLIGYVDIMRIIIALIAVIAGLINIKDFFWFKKGISFTIPDKHKPKLFKRIRSLVKEEATTALVFGTIFLAVFANMIELLCTAGFPAIFTKILTMQDYPSITYYSYIALYNLVYVIPLATIVGIFAVTMGKRKFTDKQGKILKIIGGIFMLLLGLILLIKPSLLSLG